MSEAFQAFSAGVLANYPTLLHFLAPHHNSMHLLYQPPLSYPTYQCWSLSPQMAAPLKGLFSIKPQINKPPITSISQLEMVQVDHTANMMLAVAMMIGCGIDGIKRGAKMPQPIETSPETMDEA